MIKRASLLFLCLLCALGILGQNTNPQQSYAQTVEMRNPSTWLRFNGSSATSFADQMGGANFLTTYTYDPFTGVNGSFPAGYAVLNSEAAPQGALQSVTVQFATAPATAESVTILIATAGGSGNFTVVDSFTVTAAATTSAQTFHSGTDFSPRNLTGAEYLGYWVSSSASQNLGNFDPAPSGVSIWAYYSGSSAPSGSQAYSNFGSQNGLSAVVTSNATITPQQAGFDPGLPNNYSIAVPYNGWIAAQNTTTGDFEWDQPFSIYVHIDQFTYDQAAGSGQPLVLVSKGNLVGTTNVGNWWQLYINPNGLTNQFCFQDSSVTSGGPHVSQYVCTAPSDNALLPGYGLDILYTHAGTGWADDDQIYVNGLPGGGNTSGTAYFNQNNTGFGQVAVAVASGTGSGYTDPQTTFSTTGGGPHCVVAGYFTTSGGVPNGGEAVTRDSGCATVPTFIPGTPGTGASISGTIQTPIPSLSTLNTYPLMVGSLGGLSTDSNQSAPHVDEFAVFSSQLSDGDAVNLAYQTKFYQQILGTPPATPKLVFFDDDADSDIDNEAALTTLIGLARTGYVKIVGVVLEDYEGACVAMWTQMLQQAGLGSVQVGVTQSYAGGGTGCNSNGTNLSTYNASTPTASSAYPSATTVYREAFAKYSTQPIYLAIGGALTGVSAFMQSGADSISPLTGTALWAQNGANGGILYQQGLGCPPTSPPAPTPCTYTYTTTNPAGGGYDPDAAKYVYTNNGATPVYYLAGTPQNTGGVALFSRTSKDPYYLFTTVYNDNRPGWDTANMVQAVTSRFVSGIMVATSGGTGYATWTGISASGGGSGCASGLIGYMHATGGVPDDIQTLSGQSINAASFSVYSGLGYNCTSLPTLSLVAPTGSGVTLTRYLNSFCVILTDTGIVSGSSTFTMNDQSSCAANQYSINPAPTAAVITDMPIFSYFTTNLIAPPPVPAPKVFQ